MNVSNRIWFAAVLLIVTVSGVADSAFNFKLRRDRLMAHVQLTKQGPDNSAPVTEEVFIAQWEPYLFERPLTTTSSRLPCGRAILPDSFSYTICISPESDLPFPHYQVSKTRPGEFMTVAQTKAFEAVFGPRGKQFELPENPETCDIVKTTTCTVFETTSSYRATIGADELDVPQGRALRRWIFDLAGRLRSYAVFVCSASSCSTLEEFMEWEYPSAETDVPTTYVSLLYEKGQPKYRQVASVQKYEALASAEQLAMLLPITDHMALDYVDFGLSLGDYREGRLPTVDELLRLAEKQTIQRKHDEKVVQRYFAVQRRKRMIVPAGAVIVLVAVVLAISRGRQKKDKS